MLFRFLCTYIANLYLEVIRLEDLCFHALLHLFMQENNQESHFGHYIYEHISSYTIERFGATPLISSVVTRKAAKMIENG